MKKTLFLSPPSFDGFDGGAGSRFQARREITSYWYPTWLAQPAALVPGSRLVDAPPHHLGVEAVLSIASDHDLVVMHTSTPSLANDVRFADAVKARNPRALVCLVGAHPSVLPAETLALSTSVDVVCRNEFDSACLELAQGVPLPDIRGISWRAADGAIHHNPDRDVPENLDALPSVLPVYHRDLRVENYYVGYLQHPYISFYTGRGCRGQCTFCLWPQTIAGHRYRVKSAALVVREIEEGRALFPQVREWFFDDDTFTADRERAVEISRGLARLGVVWSCNARATVDRETLLRLRENGLRLMVVGFESGNAEILRRIRKGVTLDAARRFMADCRALGIKVHGTFIIGLPLETRESIEETIRFAKELDPYTIQVSLAAPYPGTRFYREALENGWLDGAALVGGSGLQVPAVSYPDVTTDEMEEAVERMYRRFYFRLKPIFRMVREMAVDRHMLVRRLREGREFLGYLGERKRGSTARGSAAARPAERSGLTP